MSVETPRIEGFTARTVFAAGWVAVLQIARQIYQIVIWVAMARILMPEDYGLVGMATVVTGFVSTFANVGLGLAIIQRKNLDEGHLDAAFWGGLGIGGVLSVALIGLSPAIAAFYNQPRLTAILTVASVGFVTNALPAVHVAVLQRNLQFKEVAIVTTSGLLPATVTALLMAYGGWGVWSLVAPPLLIGPGAFLAGVRILKWKPELCLRWQKLRDLVGFGSSVAGTSLLIYVIENLDYLLIGRFLGVRSLGLYTLAYQLMALPRAYVSGTVAQALFPAMAMIQEDKRRLKSGYLKAVHYVASVTFPLMAGLFVVAPEAIAIVYGEQWSQVVPLIRVFCVAGAAHSVGTFVGSVFKATGHPDIELRWNLIVLTVFFPMLLVTVQWGIITVALGVTGAWLVLIPIVVSIANRLVSLSWQAYLSNLRYPALLSLGMAVFMWIARSITAVLGLGTGIVLLVPLLAGMFFYVSGMWLLDRRSYSEIVNLAFRRKLPIRIVDNAD